MRKSYFIIIINIFLFNFFISHICLADNNKDGITTVNGNIVFISHEVPGCSKSESVVYITLNANGLKYVVKCVPLYLGENREINFQLNIDDYCELNVKNIKKMAITEGMGFICDFDSYTDNFITDIMKRYDN